jgi:hypothetical protein
MSSARNLLLLACLSIGGLSAAITASAAQAADDGAAGAGQPAVVLELFTSQGCSSCPPADRLLARLGEEGALEGRKLVPLSFHVDYWNYIGWQDPFSSASWSQRQQRYGRAFGLGTIYTPQLVINGRAELVGSSEAKVRREIAREEVARSTGAVSLAVAEARPDRLRLDIAARLDRPAGTPIEALVAVFETDLVTEVGRGENARKTLRNEYVVRRLTPAFSLASGESHGGGSLEIELHPSWDLDNLGVAAFLQEPDSMAIRAAAVATNLGGER